MPLDDYAASDAIVSIGEIPEFPDGEHYFSYKGKLRNSAGSTSAAAISGLGIGFWNSSWGTIYSWNRHPVATHAGFGPAGMPPLPEESQTTEGIQELRIAPKAFALNMDDYGLPINVYWDDGVGVNVEEIETSNGGGVITSVMNAIAENRRSGWPSGPKAACMGVIKGSSFVPSCLSFDGQNFLVDYGEVAENCGWLFDGSDGIFGEELYGNPGGGRTLIYADVYYCYRTTEGEIPKNGYPQGLTLAGRYCVYDRGYKTVDVTIRPNMEKIDNTGYRYVGAAANVGKIQDVYIASENQTTEPQITVTVSGRYMQSAAIVTFFVEPVKLSYGHKATDYNGNIIDINASSHQDTDLEFPDYWDDDLEMCIVPATSAFDPDEIEPLESLHKWYWPGYILESAKVYNAENDDIIFEKKYDSSTTTYVDFENPQNSRYVVNERVPSYYPDEEDGYAADKEFYFFYNTPVIDIVHKEFKTGDVLTTNAGREIKYITYLQQILNEYAYIESLITDDEKESYTLSVRNLEGLLETFRYSYPRHDLVQVKIYEVIDDKTKHYATLYQDDFYDEDGKMIIVSDPSFPDSYSNSLIEISDELGISSSEFNTNKNWKIEFIYDLVENYVNIQYRKYNEDESKQTPIYIPIPNAENPEMYVPEIKAEIPKDGYIHTPTNLDGGKLKLFKYTISQTDYVRNISEAKNIVSGTDVNVSGDTGDWYLTFFYAPDMLTVEYRDISGDTPIIVPPDNVSSKSLEIPEFGTEILVPEVPAYKVSYYIKDDKYVSGEISGDIIHTQENEIIPIIPTGNNQYMIIYYEKVIQTSDLIIEYRENTTTGPEIRTADKMELPIGEPTEVSIPEIKPYKIKFYKVNDEDSVLVPEGNAPIVIMQGDASLREQKLICVYERNTVPPPDEPYSPSPIIPDTNSQSVRLRANSSINEEYKVETAIPTSEDLYVQGNIYSYRFESEIEKINNTETLKVTIRQPYYTDLDKPDELDYVQVTINELPLEYGYFEIKKAELYDLKQLHLENEAIKYYDNYSFDNPNVEKYIEGQANFPVVDSIYPYLEYNLPVGVDTNNENARIQINSTAGYEVVKNSDKNYTITIRDIDYYEAVNVNNLKEQLEREAIDILTECTKIKVPTLKIRMNGDDTNSMLVSILMGTKYDLESRSTALDSTIHYLPFTENRAPTENIFFDKNLYIKESAQNKLYPSTMTGDYRMVAKIPTSESTSVETYTPCGVALGVKTINVDSLNIHTPIINTSTLTSDDTNIQLNETIQNDLDADTRILNVGERFSIKIPNSGNHLTNATGYGNGKSYNFGGLMINGTETNNNADVNMNSDSADNLMPLGIIVNTPSGAVIDQAKLAEYETEKNPKGPSFAEYKLIRFPFDVYLLNADLDGGKPVLFKANEWYNLYAYLKPSKINYEFALPNWVTDATLYSDDNGIHVLVVAENASLLQIEQAMQTPLGVTQVSNNANVANKINMHIIRKTFDIYVSGRLYDLQIRDTDDPGYMNKINPALSGNTNVAPFISQELALAQKGQVAGYNLGLKLGYRFYFDLKTRGISNKEVLLTPKIYYVSLDGTTVKKPEEITLFYHSKGSMYNRLDTNDLNIRMTMTGTHGLAANNNDFTAETIVAKQLNPSRIFTNQTVIGKVISGITLKRDTEKLPYNNLKEVAELCGFGEDVSSLLTSAAESDYAGGENGIKNTTGHWYGEYYLPASTLVVLGSNVPREQVINGTYKPAPAGYLIVVFEEITTEDSVYSENGYLTYDMPLGNTQWNKEGIDSSIVLPNGKTALLNAPGAPMAIYQVNLRANNDYETEGTH